MNLNGAEYYYIRNRHGDVIGLHDNTGTQIVSYSYDTWGKLISINGSLATTVGEKNPYLYRGYRYDSETGLYYLQSRYYNPEWGRFVNADEYLAEIGTLNTTNAFAYCANNPVMFKDSTGQWLDIAVDIGGLIWSVHDFIKEPSWKNAGWLALDLAFITVPFLTGAAGIKGASKLNKVDDAVDLAKGGGKAIENSLPYLENSKISSSKITDYALNPKHPVGGNKSKVFESALGFNQSNADLLMNQVYENLPHNEAILGKLDQYGQRYTVDMLITGANGNTATVRTGWIIRPSSKTPELTTIFVK